MSLAYRPAEAGDVVFIVNSWLSSFRGSHTAGMIAMDDWKQVMERQVRRVLARDGVRAYVAYAPGETDKKVDLYGWIAVELGHDAPLVHYCYCKRAYRRMGIARGLFATAGVDPSKRFFYTCKTPSAAVLARHRKIPKARWSPLIARYPKDQTQARGEHGRDNDRDDQQAQKATG